MMKITGLSHLFKWENLHNWWLTKYFFAPLYIYITYNCTEHTVTHRHIQSCYEHTVSAQTCKEHIQYIYIYIYIHTHTPTHCYQIPHSKNAGLKKYNPVLGKILTNPAIGLLHRRLG